MLHAERKGVRSRRVRDLQLYGRNSIFPPTSAAREPLFEGEIRSAFDFQSGKVGPGPQNRDFARDFQPVTGHSEEVKTSHDSGILDMHFEMLHLS